MLIRILLVSLVHHSYQLDISWSEDTPSGSFSSFSLSSRDTPGDTWRRRQHQRFHDSIRLKPPPEDWPSPAMGAADFLHDQPEVTSISPLQAYQFKLQEEYLKDLKEQSKKKRKQTQPVKDEASVWSSSDEDFKKLLDPNELMKLNKKLAPILTHNNKLASHLKKGLIHTTETSITITKAKKTRRKTTTMLVQQMGDENTVTATNSIKVSSEQRKRRVRRLKRRKAREGKTEDGMVKIRKRKKKVKKFAFDVHGSSESKSETSSKIDNVQRSSTKLDVSEVSSSKSSSSESSSGSEEETLGKFKTSTAKITKGTTEMMYMAPTTENLQTTLTPGVLTSSTINVNALSSIPCSAPTTVKVPHSSTASLKKMETSSKFTTSTAKSAKGTTETIYVAPTTENLQTTVSSEVLSSSTTNVNVLLSTPYSAPTTVKVPHSSTASLRKMEVREKRKQIKQEMEKVLKEDGLEGSFSDEDSKWTTSEEEFYFEYNEIRKSADRKIEALKKTPKFPIGNVTPYEALMGLLKHKVVRFIDDVLKPKP